MNEKDLEQLRLQMAETAEGYFAAARKLEEEIQALTAQEKREKNAYLLHEIRTRRCSLERLMAETISTGNTLLHYYDD